MSALLSHHLFGRALLARQDNRVFMTRDTRDAFLLGNQGPDPLFFLTRSRALVTGKKLASRMHRERIEEYLEMWRDTLERRYFKSYLYDVLQAYIYGFVCHYYLDRAVHPLVVALAEALCAAGISGLTAKDVPFVHAQIEADLDIYMLYKLTGRTLDEYSIPKQMLYSSDEALSSIDTLYLAAAEFYDIKVPRHLFSQAVKDMRLAQRLLYSPGGTKRKIIGRAERLVRPHSLLQAMSHNPDAREAVWYANEQKASWRHPKTGVFSNQSILEIFEEALDGAEAGKELLQSGAPLIEITQGLDFFGNATQPPTQDLMG